MIHSDLLDIIHRTAISNMGLDLLVFYHYYIS
jgi:hypothetical protein